MGLTALLTVLFDLALDPFAARVKHYWLWLPTKFPVTWQGAPLVNFLSWAAVSLLILAFVTPALINKNPVRRAPDFHPLAVWLGAILLFGLASASARDVAGRRVGWSHDRPGRDLCNSRRAMVGTNLGRAGSPLPAARPHENSGAHRVTRPTLNAFREQASDFHIFRLETFGDLQPRHPRAVHFLDAQFTGAHRQHVAGLRKTAKFLGHPAAGGGD